MRQIKNQKYQITLRELGVDNQGQSSCLNKVNSEKRTITVIIQPSSRQLLNSKL